MTARQLARVLCACFLFSLVAGSTSRASAASAVRVDHIEPPIARPGDIVTLQGAGLNTPYLFVVFGGVYAPPLTVSATSITVRVPQNLPPGITYVLLTWLIFPIDLDLFGVLPAANAPPVVNAGPDQTITLPDQATLNGDATDDGLPAGSSLTVNWQKVSGPGSVTFGAPASAVTTASFSEAGAYVLRLTASDTALQASDDVAVTVDPAPAPTIGVSPATFAFAATEGGPNPSDQTLDITNTGSGTLDFVVSDDAAWLSVTPALGTAPLTVNVAADISGLPANTYDAAITVSGVGATNTPVSIPVSLTVGEPPQPGISISDQSIAEGDSGSVALQFELSLSHATPRTVTVDFSTEDGSAAAGQDYGAGSGTIAFAPGETIQHVAVTVNGDLINEADETFAVNLSNPLNATIADPQAIGTIANDDPLPLLRISDAATLEGDAVSTDLAFAVELTDGSGLVTASGQVVVVNFSTAPGTGPGGATADEDFVPAAGTLTFQPGDTAKTILVSVMGDTQVELNETFAVDLTSPANATFGDASGVGTILNDDVPAIAISDALVTEGNAGTVEADFPVSLSQPSPLTVTVQFDTADLTAQAGPAPAGGQDYNPGSGIVTFAPGETLRHVAVTVNGDFANELDETFAVNLSSPGNATIADAQAIGTIVNDDPLPQLRMSDATMPEGDTGSTAVSFTVGLTDGAAQAIASGRVVTVDFTTASGSGAAGAIAGEDFVAQAGTLTFQPGETTKSIPVTVLGDLNVESDETFTVDLTIAGNATLGDPSGLGTIVNDDVPTIDVSPTSLNFTATAGGANPASQTFHVANTGTGILSFTAADDAPWLALDIASANAPADVTASVHIVGLVAGTHDAQIGISSAGATNSPQFVTVTLVVEPANEAPIVGAGDDQTITLPAHALLDGTVTDDGRPLGGSLTTTWIKVSGPGAVAFGDANATDTDAAFSEAGSYVLRLTASDSELAASDDVSITVLAENQPPIANAGVDISFHVTETAQLNGSASSDPNGDPLTFAWGFVSRPPGSAAALSDVTAVAPTFLVDRPGEYVVQLIVNDGLVDSAPDTVTVTTENSAPVAHAGPDQTAVVTATVSLDGSGSTDVDGDPLTYAWSFVSVPAGSNVTVSDPSSVAPTFVVDAPGTYLLQLVANDGVADSVPDLVVISTINSAPVANAGSDQTVFVTQTVTLNGSASSDVDGDALTYSWQLVSVPPGSLAVLSDPTAVMPTFTVDLPGTYAAQLVVNDSFVDSAPDLMTVTTQNSPPVADAGPAQTAFVTSTVTLDGTGSTDVDGDILTFAWSLTSVPLGSGAVLSDPAAVRPTFVVDRAGTYVAQLIVHDGTSASAPATTMVSTINSAPVANPGPDRTVVAGQLVMLDGTGSSDVDGDPLTYQWSFSSVPLGSTATLAGATTAGPSFVVDRLGTFVVQLIVNDGTVNSAPETVTIDTTNTLPVANAGPDHLGVALGSPVTLDGVLSSDADGHALTFLWSLTARPATSTATISDPTAVAATLTPDVAGDYVAQLIVNDGFASSSPDTVLVHANAPPVADAGPDQSVATGAIVPLDGTSSTDPEGEPLTYFWAFTSAPPGSTASLDDPSNGTPTFVADVDGAYIIQLTVTDVAGATAVDSVTVTAAPAALPVVSVIASDPSAAEAGLDAGAFTFARTGATTGSLLVHYGVTGSAAGTDYTPALGGDVVIPPGQSTATVTITPVDDAALEGPETVVITLQGNTAYDLGPQSSATVTIADNDEPPLTLALVDTSAVGVALQATLRITLGQAAPEGGVLLTVTSDNTGVLGVLPPSSVPVPEGGTAAQVTLTGLSAGTTFVRAQATGYTEGALEVSVTNNIVSTPITLNVPLGQPTDLAINLTRDVTNTGPVVVNVTSSNPAAVSVSTPTVTFGAGEVSANATVFGQGAGQATITATAAGFASDTTIATTTANLDITSPSVTINSAFGTSISIELESPPGSVIAAPTGGLTVTLAALNPACVAVPPAVLIAQGTVNTSANVSYGGSAALPCSTTVTASGPTGVTADTLLVTVNQAPGISLNAGTIGGGLQQIVSNALDVANHGGVTVHIVSSDPSRVLLATNATSLGTTSVDIPLLNGTMAFSYVLQAADWDDATSSAAAVTVTASVQGFENGSAIANYVKPAIDMLSLQSSYAALASNDAFTVRVGFPNATNSGLAGVQNRRFGAAALIATVTNSNAAVAEIDLNPAAAGAQIQTASIVAGQFETPLSGVGTLEFDPLGVGSTTVTASIPGFGATAAASEAVTVTGTAITVQALGALGGGLQKNLAASLGATNHGGVTVHLASSHPQVLLAPDATTAGSSSIDVFVANGSTQVPFHVQGEDWQDGVSSPVTATITVSAPGFANGSNTIDYVQPTLDIQLLATTTTSLTGNDPFIVRVGVPNAGNTGLAQLQNRRFGGTPLVVTVANSNAPVAEIDQHGGVNGAQSQTPQIAAGQATTPNNVAGGVEFDPISPGTTIVSVSIPGFAGTVTASVSVTVTGAGITVPGLAAVGGGLQVAYIGTLGASNHGGVSVHVESSDPTRVLVAPNATTVGTTSIDVTVLNGATQFPFVLQGVDWTDPTSTEAPVTITASAPGFSNGSNSVSYQKPVVEILLLIVTTTALSPNDAFGVRVGTRNAGGNGLGTQQNRRFGAPALVVTVTNSNATVAEIDLNGANGAQTQTSQIVAGQATTPSSGANSLEFDPLGTGTTTVSASIPNFFALPGASPAVVVNTPVISVPALGSVGGGLQAGAFTVSLGGATEHGVMTLHLVSSDPTRILLAPNLTTPGDSSGTLDLPVAAGANQAQFVVQALDWVDGVSTAATVTVTASAPGFTSDSNSVSYVQPAVELSTLVTTISSTAANDDFVVRVGVPNAFNTAVSSPQPRRAGGSTLVVGVTNSNATVAELDQNGGLNGAQSQTANIAAGQSTTPLNTAGGVEFDPLTPGSTTVAVSPLAGFIPVASATQNVTVNP